MRLATLCMNRQHCCLPLHMAVRLTPVVDSVQVWTCYSCYAIVESIWSEVVFVRCVTKMDQQKFEQCCAIKFCVKLGKSTTVTWKFTKGLWRTFFIQGTSVQMAQVLFRRPRTSGRQTSCGKTFNLKNRRQCGKSEVSCEVRSSIAIENDQLSLKDSGKGWYVGYQALHALGCCTTTMPHVTWQSPSMNFWQKKAFLWFLSPLFTGSQSLWLLFIPLAQKPLERAPFWYLG